MPPETENLLSSLTATRVVVVAGKGGVGKTTVTAVLARAAVTSGLRVLVVELDGKRTLDELLPDAVPIEASLDAPVVGATGEITEEPATSPLSLVHLSAPDALDEYLRDHGFKRIAKRLNRTGVIDMIGTAAPGIDDIVVLGKIKQLERSGAYDLIVVDGPAAGHAVTFLTSAAGLADAVRGGPVRTQADDVLQLLGDPDRCMVVLVTLAETTPVNETVETAYALEDRVGVRLGPIVVNAIDEGPSPPDVVDIDRALEMVGGTDVDCLRHAAEFRRRRREMEYDAVERLAEALPLSQVLLPALPVAGLGPDDVTTMARRLARQGSVPGALEGDRAPGDDGGAS